jgi:hypothetical protein
MVNQWTEFMVGPAALAEQLHVTLNRKGVILVGAKTYEKFGRPDCVVLLFDQINSLIGISPSNRFTANAYPLLTKGANRYRIINANKFCRHFGVMTDRTIAFYDVKVDEGGMMVLDLNKARGIGKSVAKSA